MARSVWDYFEERERECARLSLHPDPSETYAEQLGSDERRGRWISRLHMTETAYLEVSEKIVVRGNHVHREEYAYFLVINGQEYWGRERDPDHDPPEHGHATDHERVEAGRITFKQAVAECWRILGEEEDLAEPDQ